MNQSTQLFLNEAFAVDAAKAKENRQKTVAALKSRELEVGKAAEHLVCADLLYSGYQAFLSDQGTPFDVVVEFKNKLLRIQVKACCSPTRKGKGVSNVYTFGMRRTGRGGRRLYSNSAFDLIALVAMDIRVIAYLPLDDGLKQCMWFGIPGSPRGKRRKSLNIDQYPLSRALNALK